jgi:hypothetical protein
MPDEQQWTAGRGYEGRVIRVQRKPDVAGGRGHVVHIQTEQHRGNESALLQPSRHDMTCG